MVDLRTLNREQYLELIGGDPRSYIADHFVRYAKSYFVGRFLARYEIFKLIANVHGSVVDCGVGSGDSLMTWLQVMHHVEPLGIRRMVYGFDTFKGFPSIHEKDSTILANEPPAVGAMAMGGGAQQLMADIEAFRLAEQRMLRKEGLVFTPEWELKIQFPPAFVIAGDFMKTGPDFLKKAPHLVVSLLSLDFDIYEPTKFALELFLPRMPKGAVILFDELDHPEWPGETLAALETIGIRNMRLQRFSWEPTMCYAVLE